MPNICDRTKANPFYQARLQASTHNEQLSSREGAADIMAIDRGRLYRIENGVADPYPEEVHLMADLYGAPELRNWYCRNKCPLGIDFPKIEDASLDRLTIRALASLRNVTEVKETLLGITADGIIDESEKPQLDEIIKRLDELNEINMNLKAWTAKNLK